SRSAAAGAVDAVVRGMRAQGANPGARPAGARAARKVIEDAVFATAAELLRDPAVARLESAWRGLKLLVDQCPADASIAIEVVDVAPGGVADALGRSFSA